MKLSLHITVPGPPVPKQRARMGKGGRWYTPEETRAYEKLIRWYAVTLAHSAIWPLDDKYRVELDIVFPDRRRRDADNVAKAFLDACNGVLWKDDTQVVELVARKHVDQHRPRVEMKVSREAA